MLLELLCRGEIRPVVAGRLQLLILPIYRLVLKLRGKPIEERSGAYLAITST